VDWLTPREWEVISLLPGRSNREVAAALVPRISEQTAKNHLRSIMDKLGVSRRDEVACWGCRRARTGKAETPRSALEL